MRLKLQWLITAVGICYGLPGLGQSISGTQSYTQTTITNFNFGNASATLATNPGFSVGDEVLIIQMQGASIDLSNSSSFGSITSNNGAGHYELANICSINGTTVTFDNFLQNTDYNPDGVVQIIKVPNYDLLFVTGTLSAPAWNGSSGGVLVLRANSLTLQADIDMSGKGFRGGQYDNSNNNNCNWALPVTGYFSGDPDDGGTKGEGIAILPGNFEYGKGAPANGGGGGNDHNSGGGGGGNPVAGGVGGDNDDPGFFNCKGYHPGVGGRALNTSNRVFLGGGGGAGHGNNNSGTSGGNGGGIVIIIAGTLHGNDYTIRSNGQSALTTTGGDGAGGGGSGGSIHLAVDSYVGALTVEVTGGNGGGVFQNPAGNRCFGPGGGGAGGMVKLKNNQPGAVTIPTSGGSPGIISNSTNSCNGSSSGATGGMAGLVFTNQGDIPGSTNNNTDCELALPVELLSFNGDYRDHQVALHWHTAFEQNNLGFEVQRSKQAIDWITLGFIKSQGNTSEPLRYSFLDRTPLSGANYYRLRQTDLDGTITFSGIISVRTHETEDIHLFPNPANESIEISGAPEGLVVVRILDNLGRQVASQHLTGRKLDLSELPGGLYFITIQYETGSVVRRVMKITH